MRFVECQATQHKRRLCSKPRPSYLGSIAENDWDAGGPGMNWRAGAEKSRRQLGSLSRVDGDGILAAMDQWDCPAIHFGKGFDFHMLFSSAFLIFAISLNPNFF